MPSTPPTPMQLDVENTIRLLTLADGHAPTLSEIAEAMSVSKVTIHGHVNELERKGRLTRTKHAARSIVLMGKCPTCGCDVQGTSVVQR